MVRANSAERQDIGATKSFDRDPDWGMGGSENRKVQ